MKQILIFGDSILKGVTYSAEAGRHKLLPGHFAGLKDMGYEVKNCSIMGATVEEGITMLRRRLTDPASDTAVLLEYGGNDCDYRWADISADPTAAHMPKTPLDSFTARYGELVSYAREKARPYTSAIWYPWTRKNICTGFPVGWTTIPSSAGWETRPCCTAGTKPTAAPQKSWRKSWPVP
ncbi:MAG: SGNH/GDSL hydrolase family protein [Clostridia bacterium]|nr:SGNH/GDSL hydrolase family protein [Clostridia bacterium]